jgi:8-oxo-dGTP pyrophosphatase MutT (NUDIX family)
MEVPRVIERLRNNLSEQKKGDPVPDRFQEAAEAGVMILVRATTAPCVALTVRSSHLSTHAGEVALPGGKRDSTDRSLAAAALRETEEELGVPVIEIELLGQLPGLVSKHGLWVTPFVGIVQDQTIFQPNAGEVQTVFEVPLDWLKTDPRSSTERLDRQGIVQWAPVYEYQGHRIWGLTALILENLIAVGLA